VVGVAGSCGVQARCRSRDSALTTGNSASKIDRLSPKRFINLPTSVCVYVVL